MTLDELLSQKTPPSPEKWKLSSKDNMRFYWKYRGLLLDQKRNAAFWSATNENLSFAYEALDKQEKELKRVNSLNQKYLTNISAGILMLDRNLKILDQYSYYLENLFRCEDIAGKNFLDLIFSNNEDNQEERDELEQYLNILFNNVTASISMIQDVNPLRNRTLVLNKGKADEVTIVIDANFTRIIENDRVENILIVLDDKTEIVKIQNQLIEEQKKYEAELEAISAILNAGPKAFQDFIRESKNTLDLFDKHIENLHDDQDMNLLFREMHSLKGTAKYFELKYLVTLAHKIEDSMVRMINKEIELSDILVREIKHGLDEIRKEFIQIRKINDKVTMFSIIAANTQKFDPKEEVSTFLRSLKEMTSIISKELGKDVRLIIVNRLSEFPLLQDVRTSIIHLVRNSLDHGVEDQYERLSKHKGNKGNIKITLSQQDDFYIIEVVDDGRGIDYDRIREKAIEKKMVKETDNLSEKDLLKLIFTPNFSSKDKVTDVSGRGYGLDIVKDTVDRLKGRISVSTKKNAGTRILLKIPTKNQ